MPTTRRTRTLEAAPQEVWRVVGDPHHLPRWWPKITRVEGVEPGAFTQVFTTAKGRTVRVDHRVVAREEGAALRWAQVVEATPFERFLRAAEWEARVGPHPQGSQVTLSVRQRLRGMSRLGGFLLRGASKHQLDEALDGLAALV